MTQLEFDEITDFLNPREKKDRNKCSTLGVTYQYKDNNVTITGKVPRIIIQDMAITFPERKTFINQLLPTEENEKYIKKLTLDNMDDVIIFSLFLDDYYLYTKTGLKSNSSEHYMELITEIKKSMINKCKLDMTTMDWIRKNPICNPVLVQTLNKINKNYLLKTNKKVEDQRYTRSLKRNAEEFDTIVNPFMGRKNKFYKLEDILEHVDISLDKKDDSDEIKMVITDKQTNTILSHERRNNGYLNYISYINENREVITVKHELDSSARPMPQNGEKIIIIKDTKINGKCVSFYNFTTNKIKYDGKEEFLANMEDKVEFYSELQQAMNIAEETVLQHMISEKKYIK